MSDAILPLRMNRQCRMDFLSEANPAADGDPRKMTISMTPDPRRYESVTVDGKTWYRDKYFHHHVSLDDFVNTMNGIPIYYSAPSIDSAPEYAIARKEALDRELATGAYAAPPEKAAAHRPLESDLTPRDVSFLSVDICGATAMRKADPKAFDAAHRLFMQELGTVVGQFNGAIVKSTGDGFIAYIDHPSFTSPCDQTVDLGLTFLVILRKSINPALEGAGMKPLKIRVGAEYGEAQFRSIVIPPTGFSAPEVVSDALNRAVKIQESCLPGQFRIGLGLYELVHVKWLERASEVPFDSASVGIPGYKTYLMA
jgi:class 3 adenylate cyclase